MGKLSVTVRDLQRLKAEARGFSFLPKQPVGSLLSGQHASRLRGRGMSFEELRVYHQGDDIRSMDWRATARLRKPHVRVYAEDRERPVLFLVDQRTPMFFGSKRCMKSVVAAEIAALGAWRTLDVGDRPGGIVFNDSEIVEVRPHRSQSRVLQLFSHISRMSQKLETWTASTTNGVDLNKVLDKALQLASHDFLIVLVSDLDGADVETEKKLSQLARRNDVLLLAIYDPLGITLSGYPGMVASDREQVWNLPAEKGFSQRFQQAFGKTLERWQAVGRNLRVPILPISTAVPVAQQILSLIGGQK